MTEEKEKLSMLAFRSWLEGVEEMQGDDWTPSPEQWKKIRAKIDLLDSNDTAIRNAVRSALNEINRSAPMAMPQTPYYPAPATTYPGPPPVIPHSSILDDNVGGKFATTMPPMPASRSPEGVVTLGNPSIKTPNIDTTHGYNTPFV